VSNYDKVRYGGKVRERSFLNSSAQMSDPVKTPFDLMLEQFRVIVREKIAAAIGNGKQALADKDWLRADELAELYGLPKPWFEEKGRAGTIARTKPRRYVLFKRRDVDGHLEKNKQGS